MSVNIPKDKNFPPAAGQCDNCGGYGCKVCQQKGWLPAGHPKVRKCYRDECGATISPDHVAVYCTNECASLDAD